MKELKTHSQQYTVPESRVWGTAYRIEASKVKEVQEYLDIREINGYSIQYADVHPAAAAAETAPFKCMVYIGMPDNPQFMGVQEPQALAEHIYVSRGPSGENKEYLFMLDQALKGLSAESGDAHVADLAHRVRQLEASLSADSAQGHQEAIRQELSKVRGGEHAAEQEETEKGG